MNLAEILIKNFKISTDSFFTWSSGIKAPFYCDNRLLLSNYRDRNNIINEFVKRIKIINPTIVAGVVTSGLPYASIIADRLSLPLIYVRSVAKDHGTKKLIEGSFQAGDRVVVIEDLISTGTSALLAARALKNAGLHVSKVMAIFSYELPVAVTNFQKEDTSYQPLCSFSDLLQYALKQRLIDNNDLEIIEKWRKEYAV